MELEKQVASLELSKRLKELGVREESSFYWYNSMATGGKWIVTEGKGFARPIKEYTDGNVIAAFTVSEILEGLPGSINGNGMFIDRFNDLWFVGYANVYEDDKPFAPTLADACAELKIWLIENKLEEPS